MTGLTEGEHAPGFTLQGVQDGEIGSFSLEEFIQEGPAILGFYVYDFSPVCTDQLCDLTDMEWLQLEDELSVAAIGSDGPYAHRRFAAEHNISFPLLTDTAQEVCEAYGVLQAEKDGLSRVPQRAMFLVDTDQQIRSAWVADDNWDAWSVTPLQELKDKLDELEV
jgi:peroxiredoxin